MHIVTIGQADDDMWRAQSSQYEECWLGPRIQRLQATSDEGPVDVLLFRDPRGYLIGILNHYPDTDRIEVLESPEVRHKGGPGWALMVYAEDNWPVDYEIERFWKAGLHQTSPGRIPPAWRR